MNIIKERTRLMFTEYTPLEEHKIDDLVGTMDKVFSYKDPDGKMIAFPTGMEDSVRKLFPKIPIEDRSKSYWDYAAITPVEHNAQPRNQLQIDFIKFVLENANKKQNVAGILSPGTGKLEPYSRKIPAPNSQGFIYMGDLKIGDKIFGSNGKQITVLDIYEQGEKDIYKITFNDGRYALCGKEHLWNVYTTCMRHTQQTVSTGDMLKDYKQYTPYNERNGRDPYRYKYRIPLLSSPVEYNHQDVPIDPYVLGAFIGNGCCTLPALSISSGDDFVPRKIAHILGYKTKKESCNYTYVFYDKNGNLVKTKDFFKDIPEMINYSREKKIPNCYLYNDIETRIELLRGLMDTDGCIRYADGRFNVSYSSCSEVLLQQIRQIILGFGFISNIIKPDKRVDKYTDGYHSEVSIRVPQKFKQELFTHPKKLKIAQEAALRSDYQQPFHHLVIKDIKLVSHEKARCIRVDAED